MIDTSAEKMKGMVPFPCCRGEKVIAYENSSGCSSIKCPRCGKFALFDFDAMMAVPSSAARGAAHKLKLLTITHIDRANRGPK